VVVSEPETNGKVEATSHTTLVEALLAAQREMPAVTPDGVNPHFKSKFVTLGKLISKAKPVLNRHGLAFSQFPTQDDQGKPTLVTILMHESGERVEYAAPLLLPKSDPQGQGSAITYMRRYALAAALGISDQEDDDGNAGTQAVEQAAAATPDPTPVETITKAEATRLYDHASVRLDDPGTFAQAASYVAGRELDFSTKKSGIEGLSGLTKEQGAKLRDWIERKVAAEVGEADGE
jgi:hypothetical protein